jgi:hypothetical protein
MYELEAIEELLEQKRVLTKEEIITLAKELKRKTPPNRIPHRFHTRPITTMLHRDG